MRTVHRRSFVIGFASGLISLYVLCQVPSIRTPSAGEDASDLPTYERSDRILCWISTTPKFKNRALTVKETWGRRCDILLFMSPEEDDDLPTVALPVPDGRPTLWGKSYLAWIHVYNNYLDQADWFYKADDDTYALMDNMRHYLANEDPSEALYLGFAFKNKILTHGFLSGGAGYVLTRESVRRFVEIGVRKEKPVCNTNLKGADDWNVGICLQKLKVKAKDTRDPEGKLRFMPWKLGNFLTDGKRHLGRTPRKISHYTYPKAENCCSSMPVAFHYVRDVQPYVYEYLIYGIKRPLNQRLLT